MGRYAGVKDAPDALKLLSLVKRAPAASASVAACRDPALTARQLLARS